MFDADTEGLPPPPGRTFLPRAPAIGCLRPGPHLTSNHRFSSTTYTNNAPHADHNRINLRHPEDAFFNFGECYTDASVSAGQNGIHTPALPTYPVGLLEDTSWVIDATQKHSFVSLCDIDLQQTHPGFEPSVTCDLSGYEDYMQSNPNYTSSATHTPRAEDLGLLQNDFKSGQIEGVCSSTPPGRNAKRNAVIKEWLLSNASSPYPSRDQLADLSISSGRSCRQVQVCLSNLRARTKPDHKTCHVSHAPTVHNVQTPYIELLEPHRFDHYLASAFEESLWHGPETSTTTHVSNNPSLLLQCGSHHSTSNNDASCSAAIHHQPDFPLGITAVGNKPRVTKALRRKGKRQHPPRDPCVFYERPIAHSPHGSSDNGSNPDSMKSYHCTVCPKSFKDIYAWKRHESGVHGFNSTQWICMLNDVVVIGIKCVFCSDIVEDIDHFDRHDMQVCMGKDKAERTFARKDLFKQHVQHVHLATANDYIRRGFEPPEIWSEKECVSLMDPAALWCGFCQRMLESTTARMDHVAQHFQRGLDMALWVPKPDALDAYP